MKKYYYTVTDENGHVIFRRSSDSAERLVKQAAKASCDSEGNTYCAWYFGKVDTNIPVHILCGC